MGSSAVTPSCPRFPEKTRQWGQKCRGNCAFSPAKGGLSPKTPGGDCPSGLLPAPPSPSLQAASLTIQQSFVCLFNTY